MSFISYLFTWYVGDKLESSHKTTKNVRLPEFTELLRHERMQDLVREQLQPMVGVFLNRNMILYVLYLLHYPC